MEKNQFEQFVMNSLLRIEQRLSTVEAKSAFIAAFAAALVTVAIKFI